VGQPGIFATCPRPAIPEFGLAKPGSGYWVNAAAPLPAGLPRPFMLLIVMFSVFVLVLCWLCYDGDCSR